MEGRSEGGKTRETGENKGAVCKLRQPGRLLASFKSPPRRDKGAAEAKQCSCHSVNSTARKLLVLTRAGCFPPFSLSLSPTSTVLIQKKEKNGGATDFRSTPSVRNFLARNSPNKTRTFQESLSLNNDVDFAS